MPASYSGIGDPLPPQVEPCSPLGRDQRRRHQHNHRADLRRADRTAAANPVRQCRVADLPLAYESFRQRADRAGAAAGAGAARRRRAPAASAARKMCAPNLPHAKSLTSLCPRRAKPATRRGWRGSRTRRLCSRARRDGRLDAADDRHRRLAQRFRRRAEISGQLPRDLGEAGL
jgi:hypothetical protein